MSIRALHVARALQHVGEVEVLIVDSEQLNCDSVDVLQKEFKLADTLNVYPRPPRSVFHKLAASLNSRVPFPHGLGVGEESNTSVVRHASQYDLIWFFKLRTANMFETWQWPRSVLDIDDLPSGVYRSALEANSGIKEKIHNRAQVFSWKQRERLLGNRFTALSVCSENDKARLQVNAPVHVIPNGFERPSAAPAWNPTDPPRIGFIGLFDYFANREGVQWFIKECWPLIKRDLPDAQLRLVGRGSDRPEVNEGPDIDGLGWVDDTAAEIGTWSAMIIPLHKGGGTRVKIAESFSRKCPVVATRVGAYGYEVENGKQLRLADTAREFARACIDVVRDRAEAKRMAERAWKDFVEKWTWDAIAPRVWSAAEDCLRRSATEGRSVLANENLDHQIGCGRRCRPDDSVASSTPRGNHVDNSRHKSQSRRRNRF